MKKAILASTSTLHGEDYLSYLLPHLNNLYGSNKEILFIPYARPGGISHDDYTKKAKQAFKKANLDLRGIHEFEKPLDALKNADGIFTGGGNTFLLVSELYRNGIMETLRQVVLYGTPYMGTSAGTNITGLTMGTTNDMPIIQPKSFKTLGFVPFNINPHYLDPDTNSTHKGETRETRIKEFHRINTQPVVGLREGSWLELDGNEITLKGQLSARIFECNKEAYEVEPNTTLTHLN
ncbi:dipeptidase PepE [Zunongwangia endophytica]|uniref:Dipeptidase PepE n=1 Tax=Zunongwangia endophytica TaxID=1808945 RepID=A0ABV8H783_9FLAO|nr:dipeptidase PepE [Zunongwangia endophytica]MDN3596517.1 dipeptidase PepE [Zunongwangia endophytica]